MPCWFACNMDTFFCLHVANTSVTARALIRDLCLSSRGWTSRVEARAPHPGCPSTDQSVGMVERPNLAVRTRSDTYLPCPTRLCTQTTVVHLVPQELSSEYVLLVEQPYMHPPFSHSTRIRSRGAQASAKDVLLACWSSDEACEKRAG